MNVEIEKDLLDFCDELHPSPLILKSMRPKSGPIKLSIVHSMWQSGMQQGSDALKGRLERSSQACEPAVGLLACRIPNFKLLSIFLSLSFLIIYYIIIK